MQATIQQFKARDLFIKIAEVASTLSHKGRLFNQHLVEQFEEWNRVDMQKIVGVRVIPDEHLLFYKAVAETLSWLQQIPPPKEGNRNDLMDRLSPVPVIYLQVLLEARGGLSKRASQRLEELLEQRQKEANVKRPRRLLAVLAGLETWARVELPDVSASEALDLEEVQRLALNAAGRAKWTALAPLKMYALYKGPDLATPRTIFPPMGSAVSRGIERLFGFSLGESGNDYMVSRGLHLKLADLAHASIWDINSGLYRLGGGA